MKTIDFQILAKLIYHKDKATYRTWEGFYEKANRHEKSVDMLFDKLHADEQMRKDINECYQCPYGANKEWNYKGICDRLRARGYTIVNN